MNRSYHLLYRYLELHNTVDVVLWRKFRQGHHVRAFQ